MLWLLSSSNLRHHINSSFEWITVLRLSPVACWHVLHVVLDGDNDDFHNEDYDDIMMMVKVKAIYNNDDKDDNEENDNCCLLARGARCPRQW